MEPKWVFTRNRNNVEIHQRSSERCRALEDLLDRTSSRFEVHDDLHHLHRPARQALHSLGPAVVNKSSVRIYPVIKQKPKSINGLKRNITLDYINGMWFFCIKIPNAYSQQKSYLHNLGLSCKRYQRYYKNVWNFSYGFGFGFFGYNVEM